MFKCIKLFILVLIFIALVFFGHLTDCGNVQTKKMILYTESDYSI
jgi:hypothetical protein